MRHLLGGFFAALMLTACTQHAAPKALQTSASTYESLLQYQGRYEYENGTTLDIAASPKDPWLYAVIGNARYPLRPAGGDTFLNNSKQRIVFVRERGVVGYTQPDSSDAARVYRRLPAEVNFPPQMWYPRPPGASYHYATPEDLHDGLAVGAARDSTLDSSRLETMVQQIVAGQYPDVHSVLILQNDKLVLEEYFYEFERDTLHPLRSATKSIVALLAGIALEKRLIPSLQTPVLPYFLADYPTLQQADARKQHITVEHLLSQTSGLDCNDWDGNSAGNESRIAQTDDWVKNFLELPVLHEPGSTASYCSTGVITLGRVIEKAAGMPLERFAEQVLFAPLGIEHYHWKFDPDKSSSETFTQISLRPRDMAKIGLLMLHQGKWQGRQVIPAEWIRTITAKHSVLDDTEYGYLWWRPYINVPGGKYNGIMAKGNGGQRIVLWPELNLVVVFTGGNYNSQSPSNQLQISYILPAR